ncbi:MAG TPA: sugar transferase [Pirellulales bacterium]|nr:sugar transferase [Pirellulales bacterium]
MSTLTRKRRGQNNRVGRPPRDPASVETVPSGYFRWQGVRCRLAGAVLLVPALPVIGLLVLVVRLTSRGPGVFRQTRVGLAGRHFTMYKLRTMRIDAEAGTGPVWTQENDPRVTAVGRLLRRLHLDEFPQLFNVVRGEMALIGPRPERPEFVHRLARDIPGYLDRLCVRPGITGLAQINLPPDTDLDSVRRKLVLDVEYVERGSVGIDVRIFLATFLRLFHIRTAILLGLLGLRRHPELLPESAELDLVGLALPRE